MKTITSPTKQVRFEAFFSSDADDQKILDWVEENLHSLFDIETNWNDNIIRHEDWIQYIGDDSRFEIQIEQVKPIF
jgi:hypothetical protein